MMAQFIDVYAMLSLNKLNIERLFLSESNLCPIDLVLKEKNGLDNQYR